MVDIAHLMMATVAGAFAGLAIGVIPGMATMHFLFLFWIVLQDWSPISIMAFYIAIITVSQYVDIIPSVFFGVPGETGAIPAAKVGPALVSTGHAMHVIRVSAIGRAMGTLVLALISIWVIGMLMSYPQFFSNRVMIVLFVLAVIGVIISGNNHWSINLLLGLMGFGLGLIGFNHHSNTNILTFGWPDISDGIPLMPLIIGIYAIPTLWTHVSGMPPFDANTIFKQQKTLPIHPHVPTIARSSVIGYVAGLIPGLSYVLSSTAAYTFEKWWHRKSPDPDLARAHSIVASETGNSVGAFSTLIPLLLFGIPITGSEALIFNLMAEQGAVFDQGQFLSDHLPWLMLVLAMSVCFALVTSWPLATHIAKALARIDWKWLAAAIIAMLIAVTIWTAIQFNLVELYLSVLTVSIIIGTILRHTDTLPLVFVFLMQDSMESAFMNFIRIYL